MDEIEVAVLIVYEVALLEVVVSLAVVVVVVAGFVFVVAVEVVKSKEDVGFVSDGVLKSKDVVATWIVVVIVVNSTVFEKVGVEVVKIVVVSVFICVVVGCALLFLKILKNLIKIGIFYRANTH